MHAMLLSIRGEGGLISNVPTYLMLVFGTRPEAIKMAPLDDPEAYDKMSKAVNPYGDGRACQRIVSALKGETVQEYGV